MVSIWEFGTGDCVALWEFGIRGLGIRSLCCLVGIWYKVTWYKVTVLPCGNLV